MHREALPYLFYIRCQFCADAKRRWYCTQVMEDMDAAGFTVMNQIDGLSWQQLVGISADFAKMHGKYWKHTLLSEPWIRPDPQKARFWIDGHPENGGESNPHTCICLI